MWSNRLYALTLVSLPMLINRILLLEGKGNYDTEVAFIEGYATRIVSGSNNKRSKKIAWVHTDLKNNHWTTIAYRSCQEEQESYLSLIHI